MAKAKTKCVLVCVTRQRNCERLIQEGAQLGAQRQLPVAVLHVAGKGESFLGNDADADTLEYLYQCSKDAGAEMHVLRTEDTMKAMVKFAKDMRADVVVIGASPKKGDRNFSGELSRRLPGLQLHVVVG